MVALRGVAAALRTRAALGLRPVTAPVMVFVPLGILAGPRALGLVREAALAHLDVVVTLVLATLGVLIGIAGSRRDAGWSRLLAASSVEAATTIGVVAASVVTLIGIWGMSLGPPHALVALALGICASSSAAPSVTPSDHSSRRIAARVADLDDVLPICLGGILLALMVKADGTALISALTSVGIGAGVAAAGLLLLRGREDPAERGVFVLGLLALLGGSAAYLASSPLLTGLSAGVVWTTAPGRTDVIISNELAKVQRPLIVLLLVIAGASVVPSAAGLWLFAPYVVFRLAGKLLGSWVAARVAPSVAPSDLGVHLVAPGVIGVAFALNLQQVAPEAAGALVFAVALGAVASELLAVVVTPRPLPA
jgi:hypothetical protein